MEQIQSSNKITSGFVGEQQRYKCKYCGYFFGIEKKSGEIPSSLNQFHGYFHLFKPHQMLHLMFYKEYPKCNRSYLLPLQKHLESFFKLFNQ